MSASFRRSCCLTAFSALSLREKLQSRCLPCCAGGVWLAKLHPECRAHEGLCPVHGDRQVSFRTFLTSLLLIYMYYMHLL